MLSVRNVLLSLVCLLFRLEMGEVYSLESNLAEMESSLSCEVLGVMGNGFDLFPRFSSSRWSLLKAGKWDCRSSRGFTADIGTRFSGR